jgi:putative CocE/NonD family hydrolase
MPWQRQVGCVDFGAEALNPIDRRQLAFFGQHLKGESPPHDGAAVEVFVMGENAWRRFASWPPADARPTAYFLHSRGGANTRDGDGWLSPEPPGPEPPDVLVYSPISPVPSAGGTSCCFPSVAPMGPADQAEVETNPGVLVYTAEPFSRPACLVGPVTLRLWAASTAVDTDFTAKLCRVDAQGRSVNLANGIIRARYRASLAEASLIEPGRPYEYAIDLGATAVRFLPGERLRVQVSSSDFPHWDRNLNTGGVFGREPISAAVIATQLVLHDPGNPSRLEVMVLPE